MSAVICFCSSLHVLKSLSVCSLAYQLQVEETKLSCVYCGIEMEDILFNGVLLKTPENIKNNYKAFVLYLINILSSDERKFLYQSFFYFLLQLSC